MPLLFCWLFTVSLTLLFFTESSELGLHLCLFLPLGAQCCLLLFEPLNISCSTQYKLYHRHQAYQHSYRKQQRPDPGFCTAELNENV